MGKTDFWVLSAKSVWFAARNDQSNDEPAAVMSFT